MALFDVRVQKVTVESTLGDDVVSAVLETVEFDASIQETHTGDVDVTAHPVELGADTTDHVRRKPRQLQLQGILSETPLVNPADVPLDSKRGETAYKALCGMRDRAEIVRVTTALETYSGFIIDSISAPRSSRQGRSVVVDIHFREILTAESVSVAVAAPPKPVAPRGKPKKDLGKQPTAPVKDQTLLDRAAGFFDITGPSS